MPESERGPGRIDLARLLIVFVAGTFVTALILTTGDLQGLWPLYLLPIVMGALMYHVAGAVLTTAIAAAIVALLVLGQGAEASFIRELVIGFAAFLVSGIVIGAQAARREHHGEQLEEASIVDPLTGVYKREHLNTRLAEELRRSERFELRCSLLLVTVDELGAFQERFGRYKAERLLEHLADILGVTARSVDFVARYTPTTFAVMLPATTTAGAAIMAERVAAAVERAEFEGDVLEPATRCTVSTGFATYPDDACERHDLTSLAEERLAAAVEVSRTATDAAAAATPPPASNRHTSLKDVTA